MLIKYIPEDFVVGEDLALSLGASGSHAVYRVEKRGVTTFEVQARLAARLGRHRSAVNFAALKDRQSIAVQYATIKGAPPERIEGEDYTATLAGRLDRPLRPTDIERNTFRVTVRDLSSSQAELVARRFAEMGKYGLPNYFDEQRFGSFDPEQGWIGKHILERNAERALYAHLAIAYPGDQGDVRRFKKAAAAQWGDWALLFQAAPQPSNFRSVLTFLRDHPQAYREALNLIPHQLLSLYLSAYQSYLWNRVAGSYLANVLDKQAPLAPSETIRLCGIDLPVYRILPNDLKESLSRDSVPMPNHRAVYTAPELAAATAQVLQAEGLTQENLKARMLKKAYVDRHLRPLLVFPAAISVATPERDDRIANRQKLIVSFALPRGSYATLVLKCANLAQGGDRGRVKTAECPPQ
jgi:tRNA pseudouridine13 synthase